MEILGPQFLKLATYLMVRRTKKNFFLGVSLDFWGPLESQVWEVDPLYPAEKGPDQSRIVDGDTGPSFSRTSHLFNS